MRSIITAILILVEGIAFASKPMLQGEINITDYSEQVTLHNYRVSGEYHDYSMVGFLANNIAVSNLIFTEDNQGNCDAWEITNIVAAGSVNITVDVTYAESGSSTVGMVASSAGVCSLSTNSIGFPQIPSPAFCHLSPNLLNQIRNYSFRRITGGGAATITNMLSGDTSIVWIANGGPQPDGSVTAYVTGAISGLATGAPLYSYAETDSIATNLIRITSNAYVAANSELQGRTNVWNTAGSDASYVTNWLATNVVSVTGGNVYTASNNTYAAGTTQDMQSADVVELTIDRKGGGSQPRSIRRYAGDLLEIRNISAYGVVFSIGSNINYYQFRETEFNCHGLLRTFGGIVFYTNLNIDGYTVSNANFSGDGTGLTNVTATLPPGVVTSPASANWNANNFVVTNIDKLFTTSLITTNLQITDGGPTNGAVLIATNVNGQGKWSQFVGCRYEITDVDNVHTNGTYKTILFATRKWDYGNNFNGTTFRAPTNGFYNFNSSVYDIPNAGTPYSTYSDIILEMNGNIICRAIPRAFNALGYTIGIVSVSGYYLTNGAQVKVKIDCDAGTNKINPGVTTTFFESNLIRELP